MDIKNIDSINKIKIDGKKFTIPLNPVFFTFLIVKSFQY